ncbi:MAG: elongation factor 4 [Candidatus Doudnabacteria bacterium]|nr:elongation factor 4 [Candidatus Doudnabacteria bacterium]
MSQQENIRNFCIIAHIDHGKSTLADRLLEITNTVLKRDMKSQLLDQMDLERERGITIKLQPVRMTYTMKNEEVRTQNGKDISDSEFYILNLIDTPGHVDFSYEVSRSLACCEGAILVVDSTQGIEAQTLANVYLALEHDLAIIPVINKIDLPNSDRQKTAEELKSAFGFTDEEILYASGKTGEGVEDIIHAVIKRVPAPKGDSKKPVRALIFDSIYDIHRGVVAYVRVFDGQIFPREKIYTLESKTEAESLEVGYFKPKMEKSAEIKTGEVGYIVTGLRDVSKARVGDTITLFEGRQTAEPLPGYKHVTPMVYATIFPVSGDDYPSLRDAMEKLRLSDASLSFEPINIPSIGFGFRTGFLGLLHMDIVQERLSREYNLDLVLTAPSVAYRIVKSDGSEITIHNPAEMPDPSIIKEMYEPWMLVNILTPTDHIGPIMEIATQRRAVSKDIKYISKDRVDMSFEMPLANIILDFYDKLKSVSSGYASLNYDFVEERVGDLAKVDILVAGEKVDALSVIMHRSFAAQEGKELVAKLKELIPRHQFEIALQAAIGGKVVARETISALRKDVTGYLYGGDVTRKMKLLNKQKKGKKRMKKIGKVDIPQEAFLAVLKK